MSQEPIDAEIVETSEFQDVRVSPGDEVSLYRRLEDMYKPNAIAVLNQKGDPIGYLEPTVAEMILEKMREGIKFRCVVSGERKGDRIPIQIYELGKPEEEIPITEEEEELEELLDIEEGEEVEEEEEVEVETLIELDEDIPIPIGRLRELEEE